MISKTSKRFMITLTKQDIALIGALFPKDPINSKLIIRLLRDKLIDIVEERK